MNISLQTLRKYAKSPEQVDTGKNDGEPVFYWFGELLPYSWADDVEGGPDHTGWYTNCNGTTYRDGSGKARGVVVQLPPSPGFTDGRYLAGYYWGDNDQFVAWPELYREESDAAKMADEHARVFAEGAQEDGERYADMIEAEYKAEDAERVFRLAYMARHVSAEHADIAREVIEELRSARDALSEATAAYEKG